MLLSVALPHVTSALPQLASDLAPASTTVTAEDAVETSVEDFPNDDIGSGESDAEDSTVVAEDSSATEETDGSSEADQTDATTSMSSSEVPEVTSTEASDAATSSSSAELTDVTSLGTNDAATSSSTAEAAEQTTFEMTRGDVDSAPWVQLHLLDDTSKCFAVSSSEPSIYDTVR